MRNESRRTEPVVHRITSAPVGLEADVAARTRRYLLSMGVRTACFVLAIACEGWLRWTFVVGAVALPYLAVVFANGGREPSRPVTTVFVPDDTRALGPGASAPAERGPAHL